MIKYIQGDLIELAKSGEFTALIHGCNCFHTMGAGVAALVAKHFPIAAEVDNLTRYGDVKKLGEYSKAMNVTDLGLSVLNAYTQFNPGANFNYEAIRSALSRIAEQEHGEIFIMPKIGAGIAGGDWAVIEKIIEEEMSECDVTVCYL